MILRRITEHVKTQNWFAVGIDFVIVVVGVFVGIQVANWNQGRLDRIEAGTVLGRLEQEFQMHLERTDRSLERHQAYLAAAARLIHGIRAGRFSEDTLDDDINLATRFARPPGASTAFQELVSSGRLRLLVGAELRGALQVYSDDISLLRSQYEVYSNPLIDSRRTLLRARTLVVTGVPSEHIGLSWSTETVDRDVLLDDPECLVALQSAYGSQDAMHATLVTNRGQIVEILELIAAEKGRAR